MLSKRAKVRTFEPFPSPGICTSVLHVHECVATHHTCTCILHLISLHAQTPNTVHVHECIYNYTWFVCWLPCSNNYVIIISYRSSKFFQQLLLSNNSNNRDFQLSNLQMYPQPHPHKFLPHPLRLHLLVVVNVGDHQLLNRMKGKLTN